MSDGTEKDCFNCVSFGDCFYFDKTDKVCGKFKPTTWHNQSEIDEIFRQAGVMEE